jgi:hypothetical protein
MRSAGAAMSTSAWSERNHQRVLGFSVGVVGYVDMAGISFVVMKGRLIALANAVK